MSVFWPTHKYARWKSFLSPNLTFEFSFWFTKRLRISFFILGFAHFLYLRSIRTKFVAAQLCLLCYCFLEFFLINNVKNKMVWLSYNANFNGHMGENFFLSQNWLYFESSFRFIKRTNMSTSKEIKKFHLDEHLVWQRLF